MSEIDSDSARTQLRIELQRSGIFATTTVVPALSLIQIATSIVSLSVGVIGGVRLAFATFERHAGESVSWLCGPTGLVTTEEEQKLRHLLENPSASTSIASSGPKVLHQGTGGLGSAWMESPSPLWSHNRRAKHQIVPRRPLKSKALVPPTP